MGKLKDWLTSAFQKTVSAEAFSKCVLKLLKKKISEGESLIGDMNELGRLLKSSPALEGGEENYIALYLRLEKFLAEEQSKNRISREALRSAIADSCEAEKAEGDFPTLFFPEYLQRIRIYELFADSLLVKARDFLDDPAYSGVLQLFRDENLEGAVKDGKLDRRYFERQLEKSFAQFEKREEFTREFLGKIMEKLLRALSEKIEVLRAEALFREGYQQFKARFSFLDNAPQALLIVPAEILKEERTEILSKEKLLDQIRRRNQELELALAQLSEEKKRVEAESQKLASALENLKLVDKAKDDFITVVSHQFRTPLSIIRWNNELLADEITELVPSGEKERLIGYTNLIYEKSVFLIHILEDIYDVLAIEGQEIKVEKKPSQLWEIIDEVLKEFSKLAANKNIDLKFVQPDSEPQEMLLDQQKVRRVCSILIRNAIQYTPEKGSVSVTLREAELKGGPAMSCSIEDTGIGIASEDKNKLFTKFFRSQNAIKAVPNGAGLGLYLVKKFIEAHGGEVVVESELNKGSKFTFSLPRE
jgi:signal transduction histidine kinase